MRQKILPLIYCGLLTLTMGVVAQHDLVAQAQDKKRQGAPTASASASQKRAAGPSGSTASIAGPLDGSSLQEDFGKLPTNITSDSLVLRSKDRVFVYQGNVVVTQGDMKLIAKTLEGTYNELNQIEKMIAKGEVEITKQDITATCQKALYDAVSTTVTLTENPQLEQEDSVLTADKIKIFLNENRSQAEGNVRVTLIKPEDGNIGINLGKPTPKPTAVITPQFSTAQAPPERDVPTPKSGAKRPDAQAQNN
jgi:lipopolysaccharide export system protein LptA